MVKIMQNFFVVCWVARRSN